MARKSDVFVNIYDWDPWWVRWMSMRWWLSNVQLTFNGTRGFRRKNQSVSVFVDVEGINRDRVISQVATAVADVLVRNGYEAHDIAGYIVCKRLGFRVPTQASKSLRDA